MEYYPESIINHALNMDKIITRFPPEPNGYLHIGHIKAMETDFGFTEDVKKYMSKPAECILRFDDTNPSAEKQEFIDGIIESVKWLGHNPSKITFTSDYFNKLYDLAEELINNGDAYICELSSDDISHYRKAKLASPYRNRSIEESLRLFKEMKNGVHSEGTLCLRMKGDLDNPNPCMWDLVFYRIIFIDHHRTKNKWCIYPSYDFAHCLVDAIEGVTHSMCSKEFESRRESYYWLIDKLNLHRPFVFEFGKVNYTHSILSKRNLMKLVDENYISGWDDPRVLTIKGMKKRGYCPKVLRKLARDIGLTRVNSVVQMEKLEFYLRENLDINAPRRLVVCDPLKIRIVNFESLSEEDKKCTLYNFPGFMRKIINNDIDDLEEWQVETRESRLTPVVFINRSDFKEVDDKKYFGLAPNKIVRLKYSGFIKCIKVTTNKDNEIMYLDAEYVIPEKPKKIKGILSWVPDNAIPIEIRLYKHLIENEEYDSSISLKNQINKNSITIIKSLGEPSLKNNKDGICYQFERVGYFCSYVPNIFNLIVGQKSSY